MDLRDSIRIRAVAASKVAAMAILAAGGFASLSSVASPPLREYGAPTRIAPMEGDLVLVSDFSDGAVLIVRKHDRAIVRSVAIDGQPVAVAWSKGRIFVGNETKGQVEAYTTGGKVVATYGVPGSIRLPNSILVLETAGRLLVLDAFEKVIKVFDLDGAFLGLLSAPGTLTNPSAMGFDAERQHVLVSDFGAFSSSLFRRAQAHVHVLDLAGVERARIALNLSRPQGLAVDGKGHLFVVDSFLARVHVLDIASGTELGVLGGMGSEPGQLDLPLDLLYLPADDTLLVTDSRNGRIAVFALGAQP